MRRPLLLLALCFCCGPRPGVDTTTPEPTTGPSATLAFEDVRVFDGQRVIERATVLVDGDHIVAVGPDLPIPPGAERVAAQGATLLPGLIDAHTHVQVPEQLAQALAFGVTTEIDMFTLPQLLDALRKDEAAGRADARADLRSAGILVTAPGGHGTEYGIPIPTLDRADEAAAFVDARLSEGSDFIKLVYDDGSSYGRPIPTLDRATLQAAIEAAHAHDVLAVVHVSSRTGALDALAAGADGLAHLFLEPDPDPAFVDALVQRKAFVTDTLAVLASVCDGGRGKALAQDERLRPYLLPADVTALSQSIGGDQRPSCAPVLRTTKALHEAGVRVLASTDAPNPGTIHGASLHDELALLVEAGLSPTAALRAATADPAEVFGLEDRGRIAEGLRADLVLVAGDPTTDITRTRAIEGVWKRGVRLDRASWSERAAERWAEIDRARRAPPPAGLAAGLVSDFEGGDLSSEFGAGWQMSTDAMRGGASKVSPRIEDGVLVIEGTIDGESLPAAWAGVMFFPGDRMMQPANLSSRPTLVFRAQGDGPLTVMAFASQLGMAPATTQVPLGEGWAEYRVDLRSLVAEPYDITAIFFGGPTRAGEFLVQLDDVRLQP